MRFLILTTSHGLRQGDLLMTNELVGALQSAGHTVDVVLLKWQGKAVGQPRMVRGPLGEDVLLVPPVEVTRAPTFLQRVAKWSASPFRAGRAWRAHFADRSYDAVIAGTPAALFQPLLREVDAAARTVPPVALLLIHDFFPIHHAEIGLVPTRAVPLLKRIEERAMSRYDIIYCNLPSNIGYLRRNYRIAGDPIISWTPLWTRTDRAVTGPREDVRARFGLPPDRPLAVFGGQLIEGRGIEDMLAAAELARTQGSDLTFLFVGSGRLEAMVDAAAGCGGNVIRIPQVPRDQYLSLVSACDVGLAATVPGVSSHSFPTKTLDYLRVGIPAVVSVEPGSSLAAMLTEAGVGLSVPFGDIPALLDALRTAVHDAAFRAPVGEACRSFLENVLDVNLVPDKIAADIARVTAAKTDGRLQ